MKHLTIRQFGPIQEADVELGQVNVIIGPQSSGKSTILKTACYCTWVEKQLELTQTANRFIGTAFIELMTRYYNIVNYVNDNTFIEYETDYLKFCYEHSKKQFNFLWKPSRWDFKRPKVSYIPADRNLVAAIPGWTTLSLDGNMIDFLGDWDKARRYLKKEENILNLGMSYVYDSMSNSDKIRLGNQASLMLSEGSSGIQSLLPLYVHMDYLTNGQYNDKSNHISFEQNEVFKRLFTSINMEFHKQGENGSITEKSNTIYHNYVEVNHSEIFLEEPENSLFPPTQCQLVNWLIDIIKQHDDLLFIATHSPYVLNQMIKLSPDGLTVFFTHISKKDFSNYSVRQLNDREIHEIYDNGVDMFFNFELYV